MSNRLTVTGNLGKEPEQRTVKTSKGDRTVTEFSVYADDYKRNDAGDFEANGGFWVRVSVWGELGQRAFTTLKKGARVTCEGHLAVREYETKDGEDRTDLQLTADDVTLNLSRLESVTWSKRRETADESAAVPA